MYVYCIIRHKQHKVGIFAICVCVIVMMMTSFFVKVIVVVVCDVTIILWTLFGRHLWLSFHLKFSLS